MKIRKALLSDVEKIGIFHYETFKETYKGLLSEKLLSNLNLDKIILSKKSRLEDIYIAEIESEVIAFILFSKKSRYNVNYSEIEAIYVGKNYRSNKVGQELVELVDKELNKSILVYVLKNNVRAIKFYKKMGFVLTGNERKEGEIETFEMLKEK